MYVYVWRAEKGFDFETTTNFQRHEQTSKNFKDAIMENGLHLKIGEKRLMNGKK
jgi:hypothetical protein